MLYYILSDGGGLTDILPSMLQQRLAVDATAKYKHSTQEMAMQVILCEINVVYVYYIVEGSRYQYLCN